MSEHSPGPWKATGNGVHVWKATKTGVEFPFDCIATTHAEPQEQRQIDARLIAAAPEMLRLLRMFADISLEQANLGIGLVTAIREARKMLKELDGAS